MLELNKIYQDDCLEVLKTFPDESVDCVITSPPYWGLRDYGMSGQLGLEKTPEEYVAKMVEIFREVKRVLKKEGTLFLNLGDSYAGSGKGRNADGTPGKTESLNKNNRGSMSGVIFPSNVGREESCDISDKEVEDYPKNDCFCENLCGVCRRAYQIGRFHNGNLPVSKQDFLFSLPIHEHKESANDHSPTSDCSRQDFHTVTANQEITHSANLVGEQSPSFQESKLFSSSSELPENVSNQNHEAKCLLCGCSFLSDVQESEHKRVCTCGIEMPLGALDQSRLDNVSLGLAYPNYSRSFLKSKDLVGIPWRVAFALQADGWYLRQDIIWHKPNPMPESVQGSHFYRHRVTIDKYEELQRMWKTKSINNDGASDLSDLSQRKISDSETTIYEKSEGDSNGKSERTATRSKRKTKQVFGNGSGEIESREVSGDSEGSGERTEASGELQGTTSESGRNRNSTGLDGHSGAPSLSLFLLQPEKFQNDSRPQNPVEQRREKLARERSASLPQVQLHQAGQNWVDAEEEIDCPGCYMCENQNGFIFTLSAGRCTKSHEYVFLLAKSSKYYFDNEAIKEVATGYDGRKDTMMKGSEKYSDGLYLAGGNANSLAVKGRERWKYKNLQEDGQTPNTMHEKKLVGEEYLSAVRNKRSVWTITTKPFSEAHFATFPTELITPMVQAGCPKEGIILDPFMGAGTTAVVAKHFNRNYLGIELNPEYIKIAEKRLAQKSLL